MEQQKIESTIWHELGHIFLAIYSKAYISKLEFDKRGIYTGQRHDFTFGGMTHYNDFVKNDDIYRLNNSSFLFLRILNIYSGSIFQSMYYELNANDFFMKGKNHSKSDYSNFENKIIEFEKLNQVNIEHFCYNAFNELELAFKNDVKIKSILKVATYLIQHKWTIDVHKYYNISADTLIEIIELMSNCITDETTKKIKDIELNFQDYLKIVTNKNDRN